MQCVQCIGPNKPGKGNNMTLQEKLTELELMYNKIVAAFDYADKGIVSKTTNEVAEAYHTVINALEKTINEHVGYRNRTAHELTSSGWNETTSKIRNDNDEARLRHNTMNNVARLCNARQTTCTMVQKHIYAGIDKDIVDACFPNE